MMKTLVWSAQWLAARRVVEYNLVSLTARKRGHHMAANRFDRLADIYKTASDQLRSDRDWEVS